MARLFNYGRLNRVVTIPGSNLLPGTYSTAYGIQLGVGAINTTSDSIEPGEVVEIVSSSQKGYSVKRATSSITAATAAIVLRDVIGVRTIEAGVFEEYKPGVPMTIVPASANQGWDITVAVVDGETPSAGDQVYIGLGTGGTVLGGVYAEEQGSGGVDSIELTGWTFKGSSFTPTSSDSIAAVIGKN